MRTLPFAIGVAAGMTLAAAALTSMYPDISRRMLRDGRKACRCGRRMIENMF